MSLFKALLVSAIALTSQAAPNDEAGRASAFSIPSLRNSPIIQAFRAVPAVNALLAGRAAQDTAIVHPVPSAVGVRLIDEKPIPVRYNFGYSISDSVSGDSKSRQESREGDVVTGSYSVADPDGRIRTVTYTADSVHGFQAKVTYDGQDGPPAIPFNPVSTLSGGRTIPIMHTVPSSPAFTVARAVPTVLPSFPVTPVVEEVQSEHQTASVEGDDNESAVIEARTNEEDDSSASVSTNQANDDALFPAVSSVRESPNVQAVNSLPSVTAVRVLPTHSTNAVHQLGAAAVVRTSPALHTLHALHNIGQSVPLVRTVPAIHSIPGARTVPTIPAFHSNPSVTTVRAVPTVHSLHSFPYSNLVTGLRSNTPLDLSQLQFLNFSPVV